jgi:hypothetical protein
MTSAGCNPCSPRGVGGSLPAALSPRRVASRYHPPVRVFSQPGPVSAAARLLHAGGLVAFPTETVYGLGAEATNPRAVAQVFALKGRPADHPLIVHLAPPRLRRGAACWAAGRRTCRQRP